MTSGTCPYGHSEMFKSTVENVPKYERYTLVKVITIHMCRCADVDIFIPCPQ